jgi:hypothetical protein
LSFILSLRKYEGKISAIERSGLWVTVHSGNTIDCGCKACAQCPKAQSGLTLFLKTDHPNRYALHHTVTVERWAPNKAWAAGFIFGIPLFLGFASLLVWNYFSKRTVESAPSILCSIASVIAGFIVVGVADAVIRNKFPPRLSATAARDDIREDNG